MHFCAFISTTVERANSLESNSEYCCSQQFSIVALTNSSGAITERYANSAYGEPVLCNPSGTDISASAKDNRVLYTGRELDAGLRLYHFRTRLYETGIGRFLGRDPIGYVDGNNLNACYIGLLFVDPLGTSRLIDLINSQTGSVGGSIEWRFPIGPGFSVLSITFEVKSSTCCSDANVNQDWASVSFSGEAFYQLGASVGPRKPPHKGGSARNDRIPHPCTPGATIKRKDYNRVKERDCPDKSETGGEGNVTNGNQGCPDSGCQISGSIFIRAQAGIFVGIQGSLTLPVGPETRFPHGLEGSLGVGISGNVGASIDIGGSISGECNLQVAEHGCCSN